MPKMTGQHQQQLPLAFHPRILWNLPIHKWEELDGFSHYQHTPVNITATTGEHQGPRRSSHKATAGLYLTSAILKLILTQLKSYKHPKCTQIMSDLIGNFQCSHFVHTNDTESLKARNKLGKTYMLYIYIYVVDTQKRKLLYIYVKQHLSA